MSDSTALVAQGGSYAAQAPVNSKPANVDSLVAVVLKDLEIRVAEWGKKVETERAAIEKEWRSIDDEKEKIRQRAKAVEQSANEVAAALGEANKIRTELEKRLAVTPMDLDAAQLQQEWRRIDAEKLHIQRASDELQVAYDRLHDAQAAYELLH